MIRKYRIGDPFCTEAVVREITASAALTVEDQKIICEVQGADGTPYGQLTLDEQGFSYAYIMGRRDCIYGLGENVRGMNKRGFEYISDASDDPHHYETTRALYGGHNFILITGEKNFGLFFDHPARLVFDLGYTRQDSIRVHSEKADLELYLIEGGSAREIAREFRQLIGRSYIAPRFAFGFGQSRWGYTTADDFRKVVREHREAGIPMDTLYMDIDYMDSFKDFTVNPENFPDFKAFVDEMKEQHIRLIPIIDAGVKVEEGYSVYEEGVENGYFCTYEDGRPFTAAVWPGYTHFPDVLNPDARRWFGDCYQVLLDAGIEGFWNDMCEPAIFFTPEEYSLVKEEMRSLLEAEKDPSNLFRIQGMFQGLSNNHRDYQRMFHHVDGKAICHEDVHNLFGYGMTRAAGEAFDRIDPDHRKLMFSRSSYIGAHRYGGIWMGDNMSWWSHLKMNIGMLPGLNLCGFLYTGADLAGFGADTTRDLALRWLALGVFTPLMRNHSCDGTRLQEFYQFEGPEDFRSVIRVRYRLLPYLYSTYMKCCLEDEMMFRPLAFDYPEDPLAREVEDQLFLGEECMIAPVIQQNTFGRMVYLPEDMIFVCFQADGTLHTEELAAGHHYVQVELNEVPLFIRKGHCIPVAEAAQWSEAVDDTNLTVIGWEGATYELYSDDGISKDYEISENRRVLGC